MHACMHARACARACMHACERASERESVYAAYRMPKSPLTTAPTLMTDANEERCRIDMRKSVAIGVRHGEV